MDRKLEYYYSSVKSGDPKKWVTVSTSNYKSDGNKNYDFCVPVQEIAKGKAVDVYIAADAEGTKKTTKIACKAAPKIKVSLTKVTSGASIAVTDKSGDIKDGTISLTSQYGGFIDYDDYEFSVEDLATGDEELIDILQNAADFGGATFNVTYYSTDAMTPSATAKLKVSATPKAPKLSLKIAKAFSLKFKDTNQYRTFVKGLDEEKVAEVKWETGNGQALTMEDLFGKDNVIATATSTTDFVLNDTMQLQVKTIDKKGKKTDFKITTETIYKSVATPNAINAVIENDVKISKTTTNAAIFLTKAQIDAGEKK